MTVPDLPADLSTPEGIASASAAGTLLNAIAATPYAEEESVADGLAKLHNSGVIDILKICRSDELDTVSGSSFFQLHRVFCKVLPQVQCSVEDAAATCKAIFDKANGDLTAALAYDALRNWFKKDDQRLVEGLAWIRRDMTIDTGITLHVLVAGATRDSTRFVGEALVLSRQPQSHVRLNALHALGQIELPEDDKTLARIIQRFNDSLESPTSDREAAVVIGAALRLVERLGDECMHLVEPLLVKASGIPAPEVRYAIAFGLQTGWRAYTARMIDASFRSLQNTKRHESDTLHAIDTTLRQWDLGGDRERVFSLLKSLLSDGEDAIDLGALRYFRHRMGEQPGGLLGWYLVSLLLTGDHRLCVAAERLLPYSDVPGDFNIDLTPFALDTAWVLFLARKTLGYLFIRKEAATAVLLSCLRAVPDDGRAELEALISSHLLVSYPSAITQMETATVENDAAQVSVSRLARVTEQYFKDLERLGTCEAFRPSERARQLQGFRQADLSRRIQKQALEQSLMSQLVHRSTLLYGTGMIFHTYAEEGSSPRRQETSMASFEHQVEIPRLELIDPVGLEFSIFRFRLESPPQ